MLVLMLSSMVARVQRQFALWTLLVCACTACAAAPTSSPPGQTTVTVVQTVTVTQAATPPLATTSTADEAATSTLAPNTAPPPAEVAVTQVETAIASLTASDQTFATNVKNAVGVSTSVQQSANAVITEYSAGQMSAIEAQAALQKSSNGMGLAFSTILGQVYSQPPRFPCSSGMAYATLADATNVFEVVGAAVGRGDGQKLQAPPTLVALPLLVKWTLIELQADVNYQEPFRLPEDVAQTIAHVPHLKASPACPGAPTQLAQ
jgi:hypothetical protein